MDWRELFPDADYEFIVRLRRAEPSEFFGSQDKSGLLLRERRHWLDKSPHHHLLASGDAGPVVNEVARLAAGWNILPTNDPDCVLAGKEASVTLRALGRTLEPDLVLLRRHEGVLRLVGGCVCFPSSWSLPEKADLSVDQIHAIVPGLNETIGASIERFLARMTPGLAWLRANWGLSRSGELNQNPWRRLPRLEAGLDPAGIFIRIEQQALVRLPEVDGVLFGIRILTMPLSQFVQDPVARTGLLRALSTMPDKVADYKGIRAVRDGICAWLR